jgi:hypothetical protein
VLTSQVLGIYKQLLAQCLFVVTATMAASTASASRTTVSDNELEGIFEFAVQLGKDAGKILLDGLAKRRERGAQIEEQQVEKMNAVDIVTETDNGMPRLLTLSVR